nr:MBL fold metallo-hydrolase [Chitinophaga sedimenti]
MALFVTSLNSGSNGNCYYVGNSREAILVDAGISCRETEKRMTRLGLQMSKVKALFISHEHSDHIRGVAVLARKFRLPVYITPETLRHGQLDISPSQVHTFTAGIPIQVGDLRVHAFPKLHDAIDPYSFMVTFKDVRVGVFTDLGAPCEHLVHHFKQCHAAFLEANYDEEMLDKGRYPYFLKNRIRGGKGHLSNRQALDLFLTHRPEYMSHLFLSHLSKDNNNPELVQALFNEHAGTTRIVVASRYEETAVYHIQLPSAAPLARPGVTVLELFS